MDELTCQTCGHKKSIDQFSLKVGVNKGLRKSDCVKCEGQKRKAKKHGLTLDELKMLEGCLCPICSQVGTVVHVDKNGNKGMLCRSCYNVIAYSDKFEDDLLLAMINYKVMLRDYPFLRPYMFQRSTTHNSDQLEFQFD